MNINPLADWLAQRLRQFVVIALISGMALGGGPMRVAQAATIQVNSAVDVVADDGQCTLREAILAADNDSAVSGSAGECSAGSGADVINLPVLAENYRLASPLEIRSELTLNGETSDRPDVFADASGAVLEQLFLIRAGANVILAGLDIRSGERDGLMIEPSARLTLSNVSVSQFARYGLLNEGVLSVEANSLITDNPTGILNRRTGTVTVLDSMIAGNCCGGGGISGAGMVTVIRSTISENQSMGKGGGILIDTAGSDADNPVQLIIRDSVISGNQARDDGGGIHFNASGDALIQNSTLTENFSLENGGGLSHGENSGRSTMSIVNSTLSFNEAQRTGGGVYILNGAIHLLNATLFRNKASQGGALQYAGFSTAEVISIQNITARNNRAETSGGGLAIGTAGVRLQNSILVNNEGFDSDCTGTGTLTLLGHNLLQNVSGCPNYRPAGSDLFVADLPDMSPGLNGFLDDGAPGRGHIPLLPNSPAVDQIAPADCPTDDQLGAARPQGDRCDIGAVEYPFPPSLVLDDFTRTDSSNQLGPAWAGSDGGLGGYVVVNPELDVAAGGPIYWKIDSFDVHQAAFVTFTRLDAAGQHQSLLLKVQDNAQGRPNWRRGAIAVFYDAARQEVGIETYVPRRGWATHATFAAGLQDGDQFGAQALADGTVIVFVNGVPVGWASSRSFFAGKGGRVGLWFINASSAVVDDFGGATIAP